ncbi:phosphotransferase [Muricauda sp. DJ-13]|uniref:Phosphotransferase n=2 Tax=Croceivirga thetidis TaxID=2721623 RepID=A0ABX1GSD8_9FLAO|nr:phosphotransferase [Croceivirga thetidis]NKI31677.1 phosphotransferase [Croceivirga thetidis]
MNVVIRIKTNTNSYILKQSRDYVQKYPQIPAPLDRIMVENIFYSRLADSSVSKHFPKVLHTDAENFLLLFEDLGQIEDLTQMYSKKQIDKNTLKSLVQILSGIHSVIPNPEQPKNLKLRELNHQHIFVLPFVQDNGFNLDDVQSGLQELSLPIKNNRELKRKIDEIGLRYLSQGNTLLHGDYYPGSWMENQKQLYVLDPEFSFVGFSEFDLGVMAAHLILATGDLGILKEIFNEYQGSASWELTSQIAGIEILRRLIGLAQLPLQRSLKEKEGLLDLAQKLVLS